MSEMDPHIELIDRYIRGELSGSELQAFLTKLQSEPAFKAQVEQQEKIAALVYAFGHAQMKQYLRQKTRHRGVFSLSKKTWYYAAASVLLIAFSTAIILWKINPEAGNKMPLTAKGDTLSAEKKEVITMAKEQDRGNDNGDTTKNTEVIAQNAENNLPPAIEELNDDEFTASAESPEPIVIASNIQAVAISLNSPVMSQKSMKEETAEMKPARKFKTEAEVAKPTTSRIDDNKYVTENGGTGYKMPETSRTKKQVLRFSFTFLESIEKTPAVEIDKYNDIYFVRCFNIVYGNPLVYEWQNRYFLHSGIKTYELKNLPLQNGQKTPVSAAQEVTDPAILSLIGR
jgi:hypothetical protein